MPGTESAPTTADHLYNPLRVISFDEFVKRSRPDSEVDIISFLESFKPASVDPVLLMIKEYKLVVLGSGGVGKSALTVQFVQGIFVERYDPTIEDSYRKSVEVEGTMYMLEILDTAGTEQFTAMRDLYVKNGEGFVLVYSIVNQASFTEINDIREHVQRVKDSESVAMVLVGNKCDLDSERVVGRDQGCSLAKNFNCEFFETSAKNKINVHEVFNNLVKAINKLSPNKFSKDGSKKRNKKKKRSGGSGCVLL